MTALARCFHLPLLGKELIEEAARRRTYWTRVVYGALLFLIIGVGEGQFFSGAPNDPLRVLGQGRQLFETLIEMQFAGIFLFLPALMCGRITHEKERDSLVLLLLTELRPWQIILQKYLAGLVPMITFLLLGLPVAAVAYAFGGFPPRDVGMAALILLLASLQVGALALWCSTFFRTTVGAFLGTYLFGLILYGGPATLFALVHWIWPDRFDAGFDGMMRLMWMHVPPASLEFARSGIISIWQAAAGPGITALLFVGLAIFHLPRRAFAPATRRWLRFFGWLDQIAQHANRIVGNITLTRRTHALPEADPVTWRERRVGVLGKPAHLVRLLVAVEVPVILLALYVGHFAPIFQEQYGLSILGAMVGTLSVLILTVIAANAFVSERVQQTLEVLLTTTLTAAEIVRQKARALRNLVLVLAVPLLTIFGYEALLEGNSTGASRAPATGESVWLYLACATLSVVVYLPLVGWLALRIGLRARTRLRAIVLSLLAVIGWCVLPLVLLGGVLEIEPQNAESMLYLISPLTVPAANEIHGLHEMMRGAPWLPVFINFSCYFMALRFIRSHCLENADRWLRV